MSTLDKNCIHIVGGGFSGLVLAYYLEKETFRVKIHEAQSRIGGLIESQKETWGSFEKAAGSFLNSIELERISEEIGVPLIPLSASGKRKYIYWQDTVHKVPFFPKRLSEAFYFLRLFRIFLFKELAYQPKKQENIEKWGKRILGKRLSSILFIILQGVYGGNSKELSASLVLGKLFQKKKKEKTKLGRGSVYPRGGMSFWIEALKKHLEKRKVSIHLNAKVKKSHFAKKDRVVLCLPAHALEEGGWGKDFSPFTKISYKAITSVVTFRDKELTKKRKTMIEGFGCLFPENSKFQSLGVISPAGQFQEEGPYWQERWLLSNALDKKTAFSKIKNDFKLLYKQEADFLKVIYTPYPKALPDYNIELESILEKHPIHSLDKKTYLFSNYAGSIGLTKILDEAKNLAKNIKHLYKH